MKKILGLLLIIIYLVKCNYSQKKNNFKKKLIQITVSIPPQKFFVKKIGGNHVAINILIPHTANHQYSPTIKTMLKFSNSDLYIKLGISNFPFEQKYFKKLLSFNSKIKIINMSKSVDLINSDHHIWLSPSIVKICAKNIYNALIKIDPIHKNDYKINYHNFIKEINTINKNIKNNLQKFEGKYFITYHSSLSYFAKEYGLKEISIEKDNKEPSARDIKKIIDTARKMNIKTIFIQKSFPKLKAKVIANAIKAKIISINPLIENWSNNLQTISKLLKNSFKIELESSS